MPLTLEQKKAVDSLGTNIIVSAGAGSGKTKVLTDRVFKHISQDGFDIDTLLVLTFTNAAAAEMKKRIRDRITNNENNVLSTEDRRKQLSKVDSSFIMTFDAYALYLVRKYHYVLGVDKELGVIDRSLLDLKVQQIIDEIFEEKYRQDDENFISLIKDFCVKNDNAVRDYVAGVREKLALIYRRQEFIESYDEHYRSEEFAEKINEGYTDILKRQLARIKMIANQLSDYVDVNKIFPGLDHLLGALSYEDIKESCQIKSANMPRGSEEEAKELKKKLGEELKILQEKTTYSKEQLKDSVLNASIHAPLVIELSEELDRRLLQYKKQNSLFEFADIFRMAIDLVAKNPEIREEIASSFNEIMIDEYQDTSDLQDEFIRRIDRNNVYMVGDIKQSIYRFRNAEPAIFKDKYERYSQNDGGIAIDLTKNFRSRHEVLEDINLVFEELMDSAIGGADYCKGHQMVAGNGGFEEAGKGKITENCHLDVYDYSATNQPKGFSKAETEAFIVARDIRKKIDEGYMVAGENMIARKAVYSDFAILLDRSSDFELFKQVLTYFNIPTRIRKEEKLYGSDLMKVIRRALKLVTSIAKKDYGNEFLHSYVSLGRSFLCGSSDDEIYRSVKNGLFESELYQKASIIAKDLDQKGITQVLDEVIRTFNVYERLLTIRDVKANMVRIDYFYQLADNLSASGYSIYEFTDLLFESEDDKATFNAEMDNSDAVEIETIHKSKGLEYRIVYLPMLGKAFNRDEKKEKVIFSKKYGLVIKEMVPERGLRDTIVKDLYENDLEKDDVSEKIRLLYVAMTRAREKLIMVTSMDKTNCDFRDDAKSFVELLSFVYDRFVQKSYVSSIDLSALGLTRDYRTGKTDLFERIDNKGKTIVHPMVPEYRAKELSRSHYSKVPGLVGKEEAILMKLGSDIHYALEVTDLKDPDLSSFDDMVKDKIRLFLKSELLKDVQKARIYQEHEFVREEGGELRRGIIDLLMEYDDRFVIIDYKLSGIDDKHYDEQLKGYRSYVASLSEKPVYCYLYSLMTGTYREVK